MPTRSSSSAACTMTATAYARTMRRQPGGTAARPSRGMRAVSSIWVSCTGWALVRPHDYAEAVTWFRRAADQFVASGREGAVRARALL